MEKRKLVREKAVLERVPVSRVTLWRMEQRGDFPKRVKLGGSGSRAVGWFEDEIDSWVDNRQLTQV